MRFDDNDIHLNKLLESDSVEELIKSNKQEIENNPNSKATQCKIIKNKILNKKAKDYSYTQHIPRPVYTGPYKRENGKITQKTEMCNKMDQLQGKCIPLSYIKPALFKMPNTSPDQNGDLVLLKPGNLLKSSKGINDKQHGFFSKMASKPGAEILNLMAGGVSDMINSITADASKQIEVAIPGSYGLKRFKQEYSEKYFPNDLESIIDNLDSTFVQPVGDLVSGGGYCSYDMRKNGQCTPLGSNYVIDVDIDDTDPDKNKYIYMENIPPPELGNLRGIIPGLGEDIISLVTVPLNQMGLSVSLKKIAETEWVQQRIPIGNAYSVDAVSDNNRLTLFLSYCLQMETFLEEADVDPSNITKLTKFCEALGLQQNQPYLTSKYSEVKKKCSELVGTTDKPISYCAYIYYGGKGQDFSKKEKKELGMPPLTIKEKLLYNFIICKDNNKACDTKKGAYCKQGAYSSKQPGANLLELIQLGFSSSKAEIATEENPEFSDAYKHLCPKTCGSPCDTSIQKYLDKFMFNPIESSPTTISATISATATTAATATGYAKVVADARRGRLVGAFYATATDGVSMRFYDLRGRSKIKEGSIQAMVARGQVVKSTVNAWDKIFIDNGYYIELYSSPEPNEKEKEKISLGPGVWDITKIKFPGGSDKRLAQISPVKNNIGYYKFLEDNGTTPKFKENQPGQLIYKITQKPKKADSTPVPMVISMQKKMTFLEKYKTLYLKNETIIKGQVKAIPTSKPIIDYFTNKEQYSYSYSNNLLIIIMFFMALFILYVYI